MHPAAGPTSGPAQYSTAPRLALLSAAPPFFPNLLLRSFPSLLLRPAAPGLSPPCPPSTPTVLLSPAAGRLDYNTDFGTLAWGPINGFHIAASILQELRLPTLFLQGNHDAKARETWRASFPLCGCGGNSVSL